MVMHVCFSSALVISAIFHSLCLLEPYNYSLKVSKEFMNCCDLFTVSFLSYNYSFEINCFLGKKLNIEPKCGIQHLTRIELSIS